MKWDMKSIFSHCVRISFVHDHNVIMMLKIEIYIFAESFFRVTNKRVIRNPSRSQESSRWNNSVVLKFFVGFIIWGNLVVFGCFGCFISRWQLSAESWDQNWISNKNNACCDWPDLKIELVSTWKKSVTREETEVL